MRYISTRGGIEPISCMEAVMMGLARDGGLLLPESLPRLNSAVLEKWRNLPYQYLAQEIIGLFCDDLSPLEIEKLVEQSYAGFRHPQVTPVRRLGDLYLLELFHGPTLAFKDIALQLLGNLFAMRLESTGTFINILGATSGDTGSAAIYGVRGKKRINIFILHPQGRTSRIQELQMTTVLDSNVFNIAIRGTFDDGQAIVKAIFGDLDFRDQYHLGAINSINWARVLAQVVYYIYAYFKLRRIGYDTVDFSVPTGNFGDIFAGFVAKRMLPSGCIERLILATNTNDILTRFVNSGDYSQASVIPTCSPSMDIQVASNFERYLYYLEDENPAVVRSLMETFTRTGCLDLAARRSRVARDFVSRSVSEAETLEIIGRIHAEHDYLLDPHTAVGVKAALELQAERPVICLATAHPAKFGDAVRRAIGREPELVPPLAGLTDKESRCQVLDADIDIVKRYIAQNALQ